MRNCVWGGGVWKLVLMFRGEFYGRARTGMRKRHVRMHACMCQAETSLALCRNSIAASCRGWVCSSVPGSLFMHHYTHTHTPTLKTHIRSNFIMSGQEYTCPIHENWGMRQLAKTCPQRAEERRESSGEHWLDRRTPEKELRTTAGNTTYYCLLFCELQTSLQAGESWGYQNSLRDTRF